MILFADDGIHGRELYTLKYVNAAPSFNAGGNIIARDDDGPRTIPAWASAISPGAPDEFAQQLEFELVADQPQLFLQPPRIDAAGNLTFTPKPNVRGAVTINVKLRDDEISPSGGVSESVVRTFNIDIDKPHPRHNAAKPLDVKPDGSIVAGDVLEIINYINAFRSGPVIAAATIEPPYYDVTKDNFIAPNDALAIIDHINAFGAGAGEGEGTAKVLFGTSRLSDDLLALLTLDLAQQPKRRTPPTGVQQKT